MNFSKFYGLHGPILHVLIVITSFEGLANTYGKETFPRLIIRMLLTIGKDFFKA